MVMQDKETGSRWSHITGEALLGPLKGKRLKQLPMIQTKWEDWYGQNPDTKVLKKNTAIRSSSYEKYFNDPNRTGIFRARYLKERLPGKNLVHGIRLDAHALAVTDGFMKKKSFLQTRLGEKTIIVARTAADGVRAFAARSHRFKQAQNKDYLRDKATRSLWKASNGKCIDGPLEGAVLEEIPVTVAYWFAWSNYFPNTLVVDK